MARPTKDEKENPPGRPKKAIDREQVKQLAMIGCTLEEMASVLGCHRATLDRRFATAIKEGVQMRNMSLRRRQFEMAMGGSVGMLVWLGKQFLGQRDKAELTGAEGGPLQHEVHQKETVVDLTKYSDAELRQLQTLIQRGVTTPALPAGEQQAETEQGPVIEASDSAGAPNAETDPTGAGAPEPD